MEPELTNDNSKLHHQVHLIHERNLEICRNGLAAVFYSNQQIGQHSCFVYAEQFADTFSKWAQEKITINVYESSNLEQVAVLDKKMFYYSKNCILLVYPIRKLKDKCLYTLAKNNATLEVLTKIFSQLDQVEENISNFINSSAIKEIPPNPHFYCQEWFFTNVNQSQKHAIEAVVENRLSFIKGPPGCGKTRLIARLCTIFSFYHWRIMVGAVSNMANLSITYALLREASEIQYMPNIVLFINKQKSYQNAMHPPEIRALTFRQKVIQYFMQINQHQDISYQNLEYLLDCFYNNEYTNDKFLTIYHQAAAEVFAAANVLICTTVSSSKFDNKLKMHQKFHPHIGILDEASQSTWADTYCFLTRGIQKFVLIGDDKQLEPTIISQNEVLKQTMFTNLMYKNLNYFILLDTQYRMHPEIAQFPNQYFYEKKLQNGVSAQERQSQYKYFKEYPVSFINNETPEIECIEPISGKKNYYNPRQIQIILKILQLFPIQEYQNIGIISPYDYQIKKIYEALTEEQLEYGLTIKTCDGYQGGEKDYIIFSAVRSNENGKIGFCALENRLNVSITRARKGLAIIGSASTLEKSASNQLDSNGEKKQNSVWSKYIKYARTKDIIVTEKLIDAFLNKAKEQKQKDEHFPQIN